MSVTLMLNTNKYFATTLSEAERLVEEIKQKQGNYVKQSSILKKIKKGHEYYVVTVAIEFYQLKDLTDFGD